MKIINNMDYTKITLGEMLASENETIQRNAMSALKMFQRLRPETDLMRESFEITNITLKDLKDNGYDTKGITRETMKQLAREMADAYIENSFWKDLEFFTEKFGIKMIE